MTAWKTKAAQNSEKITTDNEMVEDDNLECIDNRGKSLLLCSPLLTPADIRSAQNTVGLAGSSITLIINAQSLARS